MSDDDRMDRAERISKMRAGNRDDDESAAPTDEQADAASDGAAEAESDGESASEEPTTETAEDTAAEPADESVDGTGTEAAVTDESDAEVDPAEVAQRAAAAAEEITGGDADATPATQTGDVSATASPMQGPTGVELPDQQLLEEAMATGDVGRTEGGARAAALEEESTQTEELVRVLEFALGEEYYCLDIEYVEEIVKRDAVTRVPNTPDYVEGVVDLRGQITTILEPKEMMDIDADGSQDLIVVFDPDMFEEQGAVGWVVDNVRQVVPVAESEVNDPPVDAEYVRGVVDREDHDQFVIWVEPDDALESATGED
ncbi:chemotaxis protein CheW [Halomicroarcula sp. S1AR25-4]|uniref:chemotaxis protein CheW n=1 Tax=Haloarcula sp. S1AR25-4 TaxID=2950538 RepID=UPI002875B5A4|nr:chemotaxis protein CheW [Halomicroarcula sp. S1AR25-4]MDS0277966.1 chemotaxis protein CheW [Halomicroarcula sp. S1AR25-4]